MRSSKALQARSQQILENKEENLLGCFNIYFTGFKKERFDYAFRNCEMNASFGGNEIFR